MTNTVEYQDAAMAVLSCGNLLVSVLREASSVAQMREAATAKARAAIG